jgi:hypothetical protein
MKGVSEVKLARALPRRRKKNLTGRRKSQTMPLLAHFVSVIVPLHCMQIPRGGRTLSAIVIAMQVGTIHKGCAAFGRGGLLPFVRTANPHPVSCARKGEDPIRRAISAGGAGFRSTSSASQPELRDESHSIGDIVVEECDLERALEHARDVDKRHGLCSEPSQSAWKVVDASQPELHDESHSIGDIVVEECDLERALEYARDVDKKHGLCSEPSQSAWKVVDEIYERVRCFDDASKTRR